jgi:hypothetical protein
MGGTVPPFLPETIRWLLAGGDLLDYLGCQHVHLDVGALGCPAQQVKRLIRPAPLLGHQDALGLLDHRHRLHLGLQPGIRRLVQDLTSRPALPDLVTSRLRASGGLLKKVRETLGLQPRGLRTVGGISRF